MGKRGQKIAMKHSTLPNTAKIISRAFKAPFCRRTAMFSVCDALYKHYTLTNSVNPMISRGYTFSLTNRVIVGKTGLDFIEFLSWHDACL
jgi:hypothetical protein